MNKTACIASALAFCLLATAAQAQEGEEEEEPHFDVFIGRPETGNQTLIGGALIPGVAAENELDLTTRLFEADLTESNSSTLGDFFLAIEPGFFNAGANSPGRLEATNPAGSLPLLADETVTVTHVGDLLYWDGVGAAFSDVNFGPTSATFFFAPETGSTLPAGTFDGVSDPMSASPGSIDNHPIFVIDDPTSGDFPASGIYLADFTVQLSGDGTTLGTDPSEVFSILFVTGEEFEGAVELAEGALSVPEPATLTLVAVAGLLLPSRRRS